MRSKLFVPGIKPDLFPKALQGPADALCLDLEDAVAEDRKTEARDHVALALATAAFADTRKVIMVRINALTTPYFEKDLEAVAQVRLDMINLPKVETADDIRAVVSHLARIEKERGLVRPISILANVESPKGLRNAAAIACADPRVVGLQVGFADLLQPLGIDRSEPTAIRHLQLAIRMAAGEAGIFALDAAFTTVSDMDGFREEAAYARRIGYIGKSCIHPSQVEPANETFQPSAEEVAHSQRVVEAAEKAKQAGIGVFMVDGKMIDAPFIRRAEAVLAAVSRSPETKG